MVGVFDTLSSADEIGFGNFRIVKNAVTRSTRNRQRSGGWRRLFADNFPYNNEDLHDQLTDRLGYYDSYNAHAMGGGSLAGYNYPYFFPQYDFNDYTVFPNAGAAYCPVYIGDHTDGLYNGCPVFYPFVGYPYNLIPGVFNATGARSHWKMDTLTSSTPDLFGGNNLNQLGLSIDDGIIGNSILFTGGDYLYSADGVFLTGNITFGFTGWIKRNASTLTHEHVLGRWLETGGLREYRLSLDNGQLVFEVSNNGSATTSVTHPFVLVNGDWTFFACWHNATADTINLKVNAETTASASHTTGVFTGAAVYFTFSYEETFAIAALLANIDSVTYWKNRFPTEAELAAIYNAAAANDYPFSQTGCNTGYPFYYLYSHLYAVCGTRYDGGFIPGYSYGNPSPFYSPVFGYDYVYCGTQLKYRPGCREAVTLLDEIVTSTTRKLVAGTMSRVYELNQSSGNWRILADGLGNSGYTASQCGCNSVRGVTAKQGAYLLYTNNFDPPMSYLLGDDNSGCSIQAFQTVADLAALGITRAGGVVTWRGFTIFFDITEGGDRLGGTVIWSDSEDPLSFIESDTSFAGRATIAVGETILAAAPLANWLILYTDKSIIRVTLVGGDDVFNFEVIYSASKGGNALKYKFSLINAGDMHLYLSESDVCAFTQFDTRPINIGWITRAAGMIFNGINEDDAVYQPINVDACNMVTGGWNDEKREAWLSWPSGNNVCPDVTLRFNLKFNTADLVDHGFTAFLTFRPDTRPTVGEWMEDMGICPRGSQVAVGFKDGEVCSGASSQVQNPPLYIRNPYEDASFPVHSRSLCAELAGRSLDDFCDDCATPATFIMASATDFCLKQYSDDHYYREMLGGNMGDYDGYACAGEFYHWDGYDTVFQEGAESYKNEDEKMMSRVDIEAEPLAQATPSNLECEVGYGPTPSCFTWKAARSLPFECQTESNAAQHAANRTRPDSTFNYPFWRRGRYLSVRFRITGVGGGGTFSALHRHLKGWQHEISP